jgi:hypothetical protein
MTTKSSWRHPMAPKVDNATNDEQTPPTSSAQLPFVHPKPLEIRSSQIRSTTSRQNAGMEPQIDTPLRSSPRVRHDLAPHEMLKPSKQSAVHQNAPLALEEVWYRDPSLSSDNKQASEKLFEPSNDSLVDRYKTWRAVTTVKKAAKILGEPDLTSGRSEQPNAALSAKLLAADPKSQNYRRPGALAIPKAEPQTVNIQIQIPTISLDRLKAIRDIASLTVKKFSRGWQQATVKLIKLTERMQRRLLIGASAVAILLVAGLIGMQLQHAAHTKSAELAAQLITDKANNVAVNSQPTFTPVQSSQALTPAAGAATKQQTSYDGSKNTYSFTDTVGGKSILVSQQPVPNKFKNATEAVMTVAQSLGANESTSTDDGTAYIASDSKSNSQTVVFTKNNLLLFIQSPFKHTGNEWSSYINSLKS